MAGPLTTLFEDAEAEMELFECELPVLEQLEN